MATFKKRHSGRWQAQVRRKGHSLSETFALRKDAEAWARRIESEIDGGKTPARKNMGGVKTLGALIDLHIEEMKDVGKVLGRSKAFGLELLKNRLGKVRFENLDREQIIQFGKAPKDKVGNDQTIPLLSVRGYDARKIVARRRHNADGNIGRIFPYNGRSVGYAFHRACDELGIEDLHFHDLKHEGTSRLIEAGLDIPQVAMATGNKDWKMLRRYTHVRPQHLHIIAKSLSPQMPADFDWDDHFCKRPATVNMFRDYQQWVNDFCER